MLGLGMDLLEIQRVAEILERGDASFLTKVFTEAERATMPETANRLRTAEWVAGRFAAKEAALKAIGTGIGVLSFHDVEISTDPSGQPRVSVSEAVLERYAPTVPKFLLTITHTATTAAAVVAVVQDLSSV